MSGFYNNWLKVQNPNMNNNIVPMESGGFQQPFFFGGSQIPTALGLKGTDMDITGTGVNGYRKTHFMPEVKGKGVQSSQFSKNSNIHMPRHIGSLKKSF
jgi:hypothetical protein